MILTAGSSERRLYQMSLIVVHATACAGGLGLSRGVTDTITSRPYSLGSPGQDREGRRV